MYDYLFYKFYARGKSEEYVLDKQKSIAAYKGYMLNRLMKMFKYENLPETIPQYMLEYYLMINGSCVIAEYEGKPYAFLGSFGGEPDPYYRPTLYVVANPALKLNKTYELWKVNGEFSDEICFMRNDALWIGLNPLMSRYATLLAENVITLRTADIMLRVVALLTAPDDKTKIAAEQYLRNIEEGKLGVIGENRFFDGVKMQSPPSNNGSYLTQFIELQQYYKGSFFNEIGLSASFNMKREAIGEGEATLNEDTLMPLIDTMLQVRKEDVSRLNEMFGLDVSVEFDSVWMRNIIEQDLQLDALEAEGDNESEGRYSSSAISGSDSSDGRYSGDTGDASGEVEGSSGQISSIESGSESRSVDIGYGSDESGDTISVTNNITIITDSESDESDSESTNSDSESDESGSESDESNGESTNSDSESDESDSESDESDS